MDGSWRREMGDKMKLATRKNGTRDGELLVVSSDNQTAVVAGDSVPTMQALLDDWATQSAKVAGIYEALNAGERADAFAVDESTLHSPFPRAYGWIDGSAYINHIVLVRKARNAEPPRPSGRTRSFIRAAATPSLGRATTSPWPTRRGAVISSQRWRWCWTTRHRV